MGDWRRIEVLVLKTKDSGVAPERVRGLDWFLRREIGQGQRFQAERAHLKALPGKGSEKELGKLVCQVSVRSSC